MITLIATIIILGVLIFVHELGHFATAKWVDIEVPKFSIGFGPKMFGFTRGETEYVVAWLPLGGYVRMAGMEDMEAIEGEHDASEAKASGRDFESKSLPARFLVISAGVIMNVLFAWLLFSIIGLAWGVRQPPEPVVVDVQERLLTAETAPLAGIPRGARLATVNGESVADWSEVQQALASAADSVRLTFEDAPPVAVPVPEGDTARAMLMSAMEPRLETPAVAVDVSEGSPAERAGIQPGDRVVEIAGQPVDRWHQMVAAVEDRIGESVPVVVERGGERMELTLTPEAQQVADGALTVGRIGILRPAMLPVEAYPREHMGPLRAVVYGGEETVRVTMLIVDFLGGLFTGQESPRDVGGPILIYQISERVVQIGFDAFLNFMAFFSINLAILNLLPIPILDGGQLVFLAVEGIRGRALSIEQRIRLSQVGLVLVVAIMVWAIANDVLRLFGL